MAIANFSIKNLTNSLPQKFRPDLFKASLKNSLQVLIMLVKAKLLVTFNKRSCRFS